MAQKDIILDGLAWASLTEEARVAVISANLVRKLTSYNRTHTKTDIKAEVSASCPPYGRGKFIFEKVSMEYLRQADIYGARQKAKDDWETYQKHMAKRSTRLNYAYAAAFDRAIYDPVKHRNPYGYGDDYEKRCAWNARESARDKGDECVALTHQSEHVVCLVISENGDTRPHIATRPRSGPIVRTYLRCNYGNEVGNLVEAAVLLGGPKVRAALARGKRVKTDWIGRRSLIHHDGSDHQNVGIEEVPWKTRSYRERRSCVNGSREAIDTITHGIIETDDPSEADEADD